MFGPVVVGQPVASKVMLVGQAPGSREILVERPFAWTAGKTLFGWFSRIGLDEDAFRARVYMAAVCRCFPGKNPKGGDRVPAKDEIAHCREWLDAELRLLKPELIILVGKLAIAQFMPVPRLDGLVGTLVRANAVDSHEADFVPLPHPSGASPWHRIEPGKTLLSEGLEKIHTHPAWRRLLAATT